MIWKKDGTTEIEQREHGIQDTKEWNIYYTHTNQGPTTDIEEKRHEQQYSSEINKFLLSHLKTQSLPCNWINKTVKNKKKQKSEKKKNKMKTKKWSQRKRKTLCTHIHYTLYII